MNIIITISIIIIIIIMSSASCHGGRRTVPAPLKGLAHDQPLETPESGAPRKKGLGSSKVNFTGHLKRMLTGALLETVHDPEP